MSHNPKREEAWDMFVSGAVQEVTVHEQRYYRGDLQKQHHLYHMLLTLSGKEIGISDVKTGSEDFSDTPEDVRTWTLEFFARLTKKVGTRLGPRLEPRYLFTSFHEQIASEFKRVLHALIAKEERPALQQAAESTSTAQIK